MRKFIIANLLTIALVAPSVAQAPLPPVPAPQAVPKPAPATKAPYAPQALLPGNCANGRSATAAYSHSPSVGNAIPQRPSSSLQSR